MIFAFLIASATLARAIRLVVDDTIFDKPRLWVDQNLKVWIVKGVHCPWCCSAWLAIPITIATALTLHRWIVLAWWPAIWWAGTALYWVAQSLARYSTET